jgi:hypothetical protein
MLILGLFQMEENGARRCTTAMFCGRTGLLVLMTGYAFLGALLFKALEGGNDGDVPVHVQRSSDDCLRELWLITGHWESIIFHTSTLVRGLSSTLKNDAEMLYR